ncbi:MAG: hypothetical protein U0175_23555, partial [Caldilineaceae bacterium]
MTQVRIFTTIMVVSLLLQSCITPALTTLPAVRPQQLITQIADKITTENQNSPTTKAHSQQSDSPSDKSVVPTSIGQLRFPNELETDQDASTNPVMGVPVPVVHVGAKASEKSVDISEVIVGVELHPYDANRNPADTLVDFHLWNDDRSVDLIRQSSADAWGAVIAQFQMVQPGRYHYQASAAGYGRTEIKSFTVDAQERFSTVLVDGLALTTERQADGTTVALIQSDYPLSDAPDAITITPYRMLNTTGSEPEAVLLDTLTAQRIDAYHARLALPLEAGNYALTAVAAQQGQRISHSLPLPVHVTTTAKSTSLLTSPASPTPPNTFTRSERTAPFQWRTVDYKVQVKTVLDDQKKVAVVDGFEYDPIERRYDVTIRSLMTQTVQDKVTLQALGPNQVVIHEETVPITLDPAKPVHHAFRVPTDKGELKGIRIVVHDPSIFEELIDEAKIRISNFVESISGRAIGTGIYITVGISFRIKAIGITLLKASGNCFIGEGPIIPTQICTVTVDGVLTQLLGGTLTNYLQTELDNYLRNDLKNITLDQAISKGVSIGSAEFKVPVTLEYLRVLIDTGKCTDPTALREAQQAITRIGNRLNSEATTVTRLVKAAIGPLKDTKLEAPVAPNPPANLFTSEIGFDGDVGFVGGYTSATDGVEVGGGFEFGVKGEVFLRLPAGPLKYLALLADAIGTGYNFYNILSAATSVNNLVEIVVDLAKFNAGGNCPPPSGGTTQPGRGGRGLGGPGKRGGNTGFPGAGYPDDRIDAFQNEFLPNPTGTSGDLQLLHQELTAAQQAGLTRAAKYFTYQIRLLEQRQFVSDSELINQFGQQMLQIGASTTLTLQGVISGTIAPDPGKTITETAEALYFGYFQQLAQTPYRQQARALENALDFAQRQY